MGRVAGIVAVLALGCGASKQQTTPRHVAHTSGERPDRAELVWRGDPAKSWVSIDSMKTRIDIWTVAIGIRSVKPQVVACHGSTSVTGQVNVRLVVLPDGHVASTEVVGTPDPQLGECVATATMSAVFPRTDLGGTFTYPFRFTSGHVQLPLHRFHEQ